MYCIILKGAMSIRKYCTNFCKLFCLTSWYIRDILLLTESLLRVADGNWSRMSTPKLWFFFYLTVAIGCGILFVTEAYSWDVSDVADRKIFLHATTWELLFFIAIILLVFLCVLVHEIKKLTALLGARWSFWKKVYLLTALNGFAFLTTLYIT